MNGSSPESLTGSQPQLCLQSPDTAIYFLFNPDQIVLSHSTQSTGQPTVQTKAQSAGGGRPITLHPGAGKPGHLTIAIDKLLLLGSEVQANCETLLKWSVPTHKPLVKGPAPTGNQAEAQLPDLSLTWGDLAFLHVKLNQVNITYQRFTASGKPIRAQVRLNLQRLDPPGQPPPQPGTNPTSGGLPGRRSHTVIAGENLQQIATSAYGGPAAWRAIAIANDIEDPLRVRPGAVIYLPDPEELAAGSRP
jgi:nucleoid-associated protein YgaU